MAHSMLDAVASYADSHVFDARTAPAGPGIVPPATQPLHEARARALGTAGQAAQQMAGRAAGARPPEGGTRPRLPGGLDLPARIAPMATGRAAFGVDSAELLEHAAGDLHAAVLHRDIATPGRRDGGNEREPGNDDSSRRRGSGAAGQRRGPAPAGLQRPAAQGDTARAAAKEQSVEARLRREYDTELAVLQRRREERKAALSDQTQDAVQRQDEAMLRLLQELLPQVDPDFDALEAALRQRISDAWVAQAPASAKAPRPGACTPAEQREVNELLKVLGGRRVEVRRVYQDTVRSASLLGAKGALDMMTECYRRIEDSLLNQELNPMTTRQRQIEAQLKHAQAQRDQARLQLNQGIREACEADLAGALGLLSELHLMIEDLHHERLEALQPH